MNNSVTDENNRRLWLELRITIDKDLEEPVCDFLITELGRGVIVEEIEEKEDKLLIKAYLSREDLESGALETIETFLKELQEFHSGYADITLDMDHILEQDWQNEWKKYFKPIRIRQTLVVKPSWEVFVPEPKDIVIEIDPGQAFGVGTHPSTRLVLERLEELAQQGILKDSLVLDVGTGSGILAIAAAKLGAKEVVGIDIDLDAVEAARKNVRMNHCHEQVAISSSSIWELEGPFDIVLANLDRDTLKLLAKEISRLVDDKGRLLASGILSEQSEQIRQCFHGLGLECSLIRNDKKDSEWVLMEFLKNT